MTVPDVIQSLQLGESELAARLHRQCFDAPWERPWTAVEFDRLLATPGCFGVLLLADGVPCALALARVAADEAEILTLGVVPSARRHGHASRLLAALRRCCRRRGALRLFLDVAEDNLPARCLYKSQGMAEVGRRPAYFDRGSQGKAAAVVMRVDLHDAD